MLAVKPSGQRAERVSQILSVFYAGAWLRQRCSKSLAIADTAQAHRELSPTCNYNEPQQCGRESGGFAAQSPQGPKLLSGRPPRDLEAKPRHAFHRSKPPIRSTEKMWPRDMHPAIQLDWLSEAPALLDEPQERKHETSNQAEACNATRSGGLFARRCTWPKQASRICGSAKLQSR